MVGGRDSGVKRVGQVLFISKLFLGKALAIKAGAGAIFRCPAGKDKLGHHPLD